MKKKPEKEITAEDCYNCSFYFFNASIRCWRVEENTNGISKTLFIPAMANIALACELIIKAIYLKHFKKRVKGHDLYKLINELPQDDIDIVYKELEKASYFDAQYILKEYENSFIEWRYLYEYENSCFYKNFLLDLYGILEKIYNLR